ncbi:excinuclease ABC subunit C [Melioribacter roseus P3M-2]|uniref:UvrABC system protein C n=1 Tax=Melioribacter roseus (strain DSM 23840 / JCM 17771 / VKM B-2668 / P3M-2) TaxID=1191523 RepID=I6ZVN9_MELRP|nr:excinuclease ABC subunit UvrC [Melioribacter roseus]AFN76064.1 excinuclease ABC subunit C [Melioribacter roseus P3M-2]
MKENLQNKLESLPNLPGIYQFLDKNGKVIYVGKAKNLRNRVRSYFHNNVDSPKTAALVSKIEDIELIITDNEIEALVLENNLIKQLKPRYNVNLKDDKSYPYIKISNEPFPQVYPTRNVVNDGSKYFGPYTDVKSMKKSLRLINKIFKIRSCKFHITQETIEKKKYKLCLDYHIKKCDGPCEGLISENDYGQLVKQVIKVLKGKTDDLIGELQQQMQQAVQKLEFEKAADLRDRIEQLQVYSSKQKVVTTDKEDRDIISAAYEGKDAAATVLNIRAGKLVGKRQLTLTTSDAVSNTEDLNDIKTLYSTIVKFYYNDYVEIPKEIILEEEPDESDTLIEWLSEKAGFKCRFIVPKKMSEAKSLLMICKQNSLLHLKEIQLQKMKKEGSVPFVIAALQKELGLKNLPRRIECFDNSNLQGSDPVASMVVFVDGKPKKSLYRKFIIRSVVGPDDFASMREVIERRYSKTTEGNEPMPDLIMVDGGKGQLSSAIEALEKLGAKNYDIIGLAKRLEEIYLPGEKEPHIIAKTSPVLKLLQHLRDEAHRFAITFHRQRRTKRTITTELLNIKGIGKKLAEKLLSAMTIEEIKQAEIEKLSEIVGQAKAKIIYDYYHTENVGNQ